jgi:hypothetical protein
VLVHVLGRLDVEPQLDGDVRLADVETGEEREVSGHARTLEAYAAALDGWLDDVDRQCGQRGVAVARIVDDASVEELLTLTLAGLGVVA